MIEKINVSGVATYDANGVNLTLDKINYIFGSNGTGKTTISEYLRNSDEPKYSTCSIEWQIGKPKLDIFVYNRYFIEENFSLQKDLKGIFTLGKSSSNILEQIEKKKDELKKYQELIGKLDVNIGNKEDKLENIKDDFMDRCWVLKLNYEKHFKKAFKGFMGKKKTFMEKCIEEAENNNGQLSTFDQLTKRAQQVFDSPKNKLEFIQKIHYDISLEKQDIFTTKIVGKDDIDIAELINKLNMSDWVQQGHEHLKKTVDICPFCQQLIPDGFKEKLEEYFDETYSNQIKELTVAITNYKNEVSSSLDHCHLLLTKDLPYVDKDKIELIFENVKNTYNENLQLIARKLNEPSRIIELRTLNDYIKQINNEINRANDQIAEQNKVIDNLKDEENNLTNDIWRFIVEENKKNFKHYKESYYKEKSALQGMKKRKNELIQHKNKIENDLINLQNQLTSVLPSINEINSLLKSFGFTNFRLAEAEQNGFYKIIRENGEDAKETLSEGEKTFISFLYFYQLINGGNDPSKVNTPRVIVIDDPISSLDSNILFIVSRLINDLKNKIRENDPIFKQLIILTHNVYFHKEISFNKGKPKILKDETFWVLRKANNVSYITKYEENPVKNSYELLWKELKENIDYITAPNIMRRILENYFKFFGNIEVDEVIESFAEEEKIVCNSLLSYVHDGSHHINDDLYLDSNPESNRNYFEIFKRIFINSNHEAHFEMMMGDFEIDSEIGDKEIMDDSEVQQAEDEAAMTKN